MSTLVLARVQLASQDPAAKLLSAPLCSHKILYMQVRTSDDAFGSRRGQWSDGKLILYCQFSFVVLNRCRWRNLCLSAPSFFLVGGSCPLGPPRWRGGGGYNVYYAWLRTVSATGVAPLARGTARATSPTLPSPPHLASLPSSTAGRLRSVASSASRRR